MCTYPHHRADDSASGETVRSLTLRMPQRYGMRAFRPPFKGP
jgi:hypothetical protein